RPGIDLPRGALPRRASFGPLLDGRRSTSAREPRRLRLRDLAAVLEASYASIPTAGGAQRRRVPSGGALYPLELYVLALRVARVEASTLHYDPYRHRLETLGPVEADDVKAALVDPSLAEGASALVVVTAMFWRSRFKYGLRGYRFALLEAGHVVQNAALAAAAIGLHALPLGGFYDRRLDRLGGADRPDEAAGYPPLLGAGPGPAR